MERLFDLLVRAVQTALYYLFFTIWGWIVLLLVVVPIVRKRLSTWRRRRNFYQARRAELQNPKNASARFQIGVIHYDGRQLRRALHFFKEAVTISEQHGSRVDPKLYQYLGHTLRRLGHHAQAVVAYEAGLEEAPESGRGDSECGIAISHQRTGRLEEAERWYRRSSERNTSFLEPRLRLASLLDRRGENEEARSILAEARSTYLPAFVQRRERRWRLMLHLYPVLRFFL